MTLSPRLRSSARRSRRGGFPPPLFDEIPRGGDIVGLTWQPHRPFGFCSPRLWPCGRRRGAAAESWRRLSVRPPPLATTMMITRSTSTTTITRHAAGTRMSNHLRAMTMTTAAARTTTGRWTWSNRSRCRRLSRRAPSAGQSSPSLPACLMSSFGRPLTALSDRQRRHPWGYCAHTDLCTRAVACC